MANGFAQAGLALQGLSAGLGGRGIEFQKQLRQSREDERLGRERQTKLDTERRKTLFTDAAAGLELGQQNNWAGLLQLANNRVSQLQTNFPDVDRKDTEQIVELARAAADGSTEAQQLLMDTLRNTVQVGIADKILPKPEAPERVKSSEIINGFIIQDLGKGKFSKIRVIDESDLGGSNATLETRRELLKDLSSDNIQTRNSAAVALGLEGRASGAAPQVIMIGGVPHIFDQKSKSVVPVEVSGQEVTPQDVAKTVKIIAEGKAQGTARGTARGEAATAPLVARTRATIATAVKLAGAEASARGETLTDLARAEAALPGLQETMDQLRELAPIVTSTFAGKIFDTAVKESGFGATKGSTAKAKFIAIINNQVLPLLKPTFGAAFTEREGEALKATMGDPDSSPAEKLAQLDVFIAQKIRDIGTKRRELGIVTDEATPDTTTQEAPTATNPTTGQRMVFTNGQWQPTT